MKYKISWDKNKEFITKDNYELRSCVDELYKYGYNDFTVFVYEEEEDVK